jgi:hypothetical protein
MILSSIFLNNLINNLINIFIFIIDNNLIILFTLLSIILIPFIFLSGRAGKILDTVWKSTTIVAGASIAHKNIFGDSGSNSNNNNDKKDEDKKDENNNNDKKDENNNNDKKDETKEDNKK